jgi:P pilus assembly chaperone PapD
MYMQYLVLGIRMVVIGLLLGTAWPCAAQVLLSPVVVEMSSRARTSVVSVTLSDAATRPVRLQAELLQWQQGLQGEAITKPTDELLVSPVIADLLPGQQQLFRVALRGARRAPEELAYRLILEDVAEPDVDEDGNQLMAINFRMRHDLAVLIGPVDKANAELRWKLCPSGSGHKESSPDNAPGSVDTCLRLFNSGNIRVKLKSLTLRGENWQVAVPQKDTVSLLAGAEREIRLRLSPSQSGMLRSVEVQIASDETLQAIAGGF